MHLSLRLFHESVHQQFLFKSCNALKKNKWVSTANKWVFWCIATHEHFPWYDVFISYMLRFSFLTDTFQRLEANDCENIYIIHPIRDTNDRTSLWKFQYVQYEIKWWFWRHTCTCSCKLWPSEWLSSTYIYM